MLETAFVLAFVASIALLSTAGRVLILFLCRSLRMTSA